MKTHSSPSSLRLQFILFRPGYCASLQFRFHLGCILTGLLALNCACIKNYRTVGSDNFYVQKGVKKKSYKKVSDLSADSKITDLSDSIRKIIKVQGSDTTKHKSEVLNANVLEDQDPGVASLLSKTKLDPGDIESHFDLAVTYHRYRIFDKAYGEYQQALQLDPQEASFYESIGRLWRDWGAPHLGIDELQKALQFNPNFVEAWNSLGTIYDVLGEFDRARQCYQNALEIKPDLDFVHNNLCFSYLQIGNLEKAIFHGEAAVSLNPDSQVAHNNLGLAYGMIGDFGKAIEEFKLAGDEGGAHNNLGVVLLKKQKIIEAMDQFKAASKLRLFYKRARDNYYYAKSLKLGIDRNRNKLGLERNPELAFDTAADLALSSESSLSQMTLSLNLIRAAPECLLARMTAQIIDPAFELRFNSPVVKFEIVDQQNVSMEAQILASYLRDQKYFFTGFRRCSGPKPIRTVVYYKPGLVAPALELAHRIPGNQEVLKTPSLDQSSELRIVVGRDVFSFIKKIQAILN